MRRAIEIDPHALDRLLERHHVMLRELAERSGTKLSRGYALFVLNCIATRGRFLGWEPSDLDGLGQSTWIDDETGIKFCVDGAGLMRTVLPDGA